VNKTRTEVLHTHFPS